MEIHYTNHFVRKYKKLPREIKDLAKDKEKIFRDNPFDNILKTHKLSGKMGGRWSFSITHSYRIIFRMLENNIFVFHDVGNHDIYKK